MKKLRRFGQALCIFAMGFAVCFFWGCGSNGHQNSNKLSRWLKDNNKIKVLSTTCMIGDIVKAVGGEYVDNYTLIGPELDPHSYQLVKGDDEKLSFANIIFYSGLGLEHGPSLREFLHQHKTAVGLADGIAKQFPDKVLYYGGQADPHIWMDASLWAHIVPQIVDVLSQYDPEHAEEYRRNGTKIEVEILALHVQLGNRLGEVPDSKRYLVTSHDAFNYFARAYLATEEERKNNDWQIRFEAPEGLSPDSQLSATDIQHILNHMLKFKISVIFPESNVSKDSLLKLEHAAEERGLDVDLAHVPLFGDAMGKHGSPGDTYLKMLKHNADVISDHLAP